jgi:hypothetical protein
VLHGASGDRDLRRVLRYRNLVVRQATRMKNRIAGLLMETGTAYNKDRLVVACHIVGFSSKVVHDSPAALSYLWGYFCELSRQTGWSKCWR